MEKTKHSANIQGANENLSLENKDSVSALPSKLEETKILQILDNLPTQKIGLINAIASFIARNGKLIKPIQVDKNGNISNNLLWFIAAKQAGYEIQPEDIHIVDVPEDQLKEFTLMSVFLSENYDKTRLALLAVEHYSELKKITDSEAKKSGKIGKNTRRAISEMIGISEGLIGEALSLKKTHKDIFDFLKKSSYTFRDKKAIIAVKENDSKRFILLLNNEMTLQQALYRLPIEVKVSLTSKETERRLSNVHDIFDEDISAQEESTEDHSQKSNISSEDFWKDFEEDIENNNSSKTSQVHISKKSFDYEQLILDEANIEFHLPRSKYLSTIDKSKYEFSRNNNLINASNDSTEELISKEFVMSDSSDNDNQDALFNLDFKQIIKKTDLIDVSNETNEDSIVQELKKPFTCGIDNYDELFNLDGETDAPEVTDFHYLFLPERKELDRETQSRQNLKLLKLKEKGKIHQFKEVLRSLAHIAFEFNDPNPKAITPNGIRALLEKSITLQNIALRLVSDFSDRATPIEAKKIDILKQEIISFESNIQDLIFYK